jgi:hypothetical protein
MVQMTWQNLAFVLSDLSRFVQSPWEVHLKAASSVLAYIADVNKLTDWVDRDHTANPYTLRSVTGYIVSLNNCQVSRKSK